jgi:hypothetical protein
MQITQNKIEYNNYSPQLKKELDAARPKTSEAGRKQAVYFETTKKTLKNGVYTYPNSVSVPSTDTIRDPHTGEYIEIAYLIRPSTGEKGRIVFEGSSAGRLMCTSGAASDSLFNYLYLSNYNQDNSIHAERNIKPIGGFLFTKVKPAETATEKIKRDRRIRDAKNSIDAFPDNLLKTYAYALNIKDINEFSDSEEMRVKLLELADKNPEIILTFDKDYDKKLELWVRRLEEKNIIEWGNGKCVLSATGDKLFGFKVGADRIDSLKTFLIENKEVDEMLKHQLEQAELLHK